MSTTKTVAATPYHKDYGTTTDNQNPDNTENTDPNEQATQTDGDKATSDLSKSNKANYEKRWKDLKTYHDTEITKARARIAELEEANNSSKLAPPKTEEELADFREQYPEFFDAMLTVSQQQATTQTKELESQLNNMRAKLMETEAEKAMAQISKAHPDYIELVASPEFQTWLEDQDPTIQSWVAENESNASPFIRALDLYKMDSGANTAAKGRSKPKSKQADSTAADAVNVGGGAVTIGDTDKRIWTTSEIGAMSTDIYRQYKDELDLAAKEGRIVKA